MKRAFVIISFLFLISIAAALTINEPEEIYQLGDKLYITTTELKGYPSGNLNIDLKCSNNTVNLLKISARAFPEDGGQSYSIPYKYLTANDLEIDNVKSILGNCYVKVNLADEVVETKKFLITRTIKLDASVNKIKYNPGEEVLLELSAKRADGKPFSGYYDFANFSNKKGNFSEGEAEIKLKVDDNKAPGKYFLEIEVYDEDQGGNKLNFGNKSLFIVVNQVATSVESAISSNEVVPGDSLKLQPKLLDQIGEVMSSSISVHLTGPNEEKKDFNVQSGQELNIPFETNATKGVWNIYTVAGKLTQEAELTVLGVERVNYTIENNLLKVRNVGNIDYVGEARVVIGETENKIDLKLGVGEEKEFILEAPEGEYTITVDDGENSLSGTGFLTGNAINIKESGSSESSIRGFSLMWIFLIFLVGSLGFVTVAMYKRTKVVGNTKSSFKNKMMGWGGKFRPIKKKTEQKTDMIDVSNQKKIQNAESSLVLNGEKVNSNIISIKIDDKDMFNEDIQKEIVKIIRDCSGLKGVVDVKEDYIYLIYSPLLTKSFNNDLTSVKVALQVKSRLDEFKKTMKGELKYGIGVNSGDLISEKTATSLKYTGVGNTIIYSNKMASESDNSVYVSSKIRHGLLRNLKVSETKELEGNKIYEIQGIVNREADRAKLKDLLKRIE